MLQIRSRLDVADNTGARMAKMIGVIGKKNAQEAFIGDVITAHIREASTGGAVKKGEVVRAVLLSKVIPKDPEQLKQIVKESFNCKLIKSGQSTPWILEIYI